MDKKIISRQKWQVALTYVGAVIGAGFASGQEILKFFGTFRSWGVIGALLAGLLFAVLGKIIMEAAALRETRSYEAFITYLFGGKAVILDGIIALFLFVGLGAMLAASGSIFTQAWGIALWKGFVAAAALTYVLLLVGIDGMLWFNTLFVPALILVCVSVAVLGILGANGPVVPAEGNFQVSHDNWILGAFLYVAYNLVPGMVVLVSLETKMKTSCGEGGFLGGVILGLIAALLCGALLSQGSEITSRDIPMLALASKINPLLGGCYNFVLLIAMLTTALSNGMGLLKRLEGSRKCPRAVLAGLILLPAGVFLNWPLAEIVSKIYPLLGYIGLMVMIAVIIRLKPRA